jgi:hypothetical protein
MLPRLASGAVALRHQLGVPSRDFSASRGLLAVDEHLKQRCEYFCQRVRLGAGQRLKANHLPHHLKSGYER